MKLPHDTRYGTESFLNYSTLSSIISYDTYGTRIVNPLGIVTKKEQTDAMAIGSMVDEHLTEGVDFYSKYTPVAKRTGKTENEITNSMFEAVDNAIKTYDLLPPELLELLDNSNTQETLECTKLKIKGKMDYYNAEKGYIIDLKVPGSIDMFTKDLYIGRDRHINTNHRYVRQLAWYSYLVEQAYGMYPQASLLAISHKGEAIFIDIPEEARQIAWATLLEDIEAVREHTGFSYLVVPQEDTISQEAIDNWGE